MKLRNIPFGYRMENGEIAVHPMEAELVHQIFDLYLNGLGYKTIVKHLNTGALPYRPGAAWNQNMVKRILENTRYLGQQGYPAIISAADFDAAAAKKEGNPRCRQQRREVEAPFHDYRLLPYETSAKVRRMANEINWALERRPNPDTIRPLIFACAAEKYDATGVVCDG